MDRLEPSIQILRNGRSIGTSEMGALSNGNLWHSNPWKWTEEEDCAFQKSKEMLSSSSLLVHFDPRKELILACDASSHGIRVVLSHQMEDGSERPVAYASRTLLPAEKNYSPN